MYTANAAANDAFECTAICPSVGSAMTRSAGTKGSRGT
jgi:hypothetical protein